MSNKPTNLLNHRRKYDSDKLPNLTGKPFLNTLKNALGCTRGMVPVEGKKRMGKFFIQKYFGRDWTGRYLRHVLLTITDNHYDKETGKCKAYQQNASGISWAIAFLNKETTYDYDTWVEMGLDKLYTNSTIHNEELQKQIKEIELSFFIEKHQEELTSGNLHYEDKSDRYWNPIQSIRKETRTELYVTYGYDHMYDIETCAPTLIYQLSLQCGMDVYLPTINYFLDKKQEFRQRIADEAGIDIKVAKEIILSLFCGATLGRNRRFSTFEMVDFNYKTMEKLMNSDLLKELRKDIKEIWKCIEDAGLTYVTYRTNKKTGNLNKVRMSPKQKWSIYFKQERIVINAVKEYLDSKGIKYVLEHDGWVTSSRINEKELYQYILDKTGFDLKFDYKSLNTIIETAPEGGEENLHQHPTVRLNSYDQLGMVEKVTEVALS